MLKKSNGQSIIQVLVAVAIVGIVMAGFVTMLENQERATRGLSEKLASADLTQALISAVTGNSVCTFELTNAGPWIAGTVPATFDASKIGSKNPPVIQLKKILAGPAAAAPTVAQAGNPASPDASSAIISTIQIDNIVGPASGNTFTATLSATLDTSRLVRALNPASAQITLQTTGGGNTKTITSCQGSIAPPVVKVASGRVTQGDTISPIPGYSQSDCQLIVSMEDAHISTLGGGDGAPYTGNIGDNGLWGDDHWGGSEAYYDAGWNVTCQFLFTYFAIYNDATNAFQGNDPVWYNGNCRYLMVCSH